MELRKGLRHDLDCRYIIEFISSIQIMNRVNIRFCSHELHLILHLMQLLFFVFMNEQVINQKRTPMNRLMRRGNLVSMSRLEKDTRSPKLQFF